MKGFIRARFGGLLQKTAAATTLFALLTTFFLVSPIFADTGTGTVSLTTIGAPATEDFNTLANTAASTTNASLPTGWYLTETGGGARDNEQYAVDTGGSAAGDAYSYGAAGGTDRALGGLRSGTLIPVYGAKFTNNTGSTITSLDISYTGEQWRLGTAGRADRIDFQISTNATDLSTGAYADVDTLDFTTPNTVTTGAKDGNVAANRTIITSSISGLSIAGGATFFIRWSDIDASGADDGLSVDDFSITPRGGTPADNPPTVTGTVPTDNAVNVPSNSNVSVAFSEAVTATSSSFRISCATSGAHPFTLSGGATTFTIDPTTDFAQNEVCTVTVFAAQVADQDGTPNNLAADYVFDFTVNDFVATNPSATGSSANPSTLRAGNSTLLTVTVTPGTNPTSTGITVTGNLTSIGGAAAQQFFDDGSNGDQTAGDNVFSYLASVPTDVAAGAETLPVSIADAQSRAASTTISLTVTAAPTAAQPLPFSQDWSNTNQITVNDDWSGVPGIVGYRGDSLTTDTGGDPQTITADGSSTPMTVLANQTDPNAITSGGVAEFEIANPTIALQGSGTADAPHIVINVDTTGQDDITISYNVRDLESSADNAAQPVALQYRVGSTGNYTNVPAALVADATTANQATRVTAVHVALPAAVTNQSLVQLRIITANAVGSDEWVGIDDIRIVSGGTVPLSGSGSAASTQVETGSTTLLRVSVNPGTNPPSTGIAVTGNLTNIGGSAAQTFYDDGTHGDRTAGDNVFSYLATVGANSSSGTTSLPVTVTDAQSRTANASINLTIIVGASPSEHLVMGNPSNATTDVDNPFNYLLPKNQYVMSYHRDRGIPNWVSWHLDSSWLGSAPRQDDFRPDDSLPADWYRVTQFSYSGSGFDRGHHTPSADRTRSISDNSATFLMTNMMPQAPGNNQGPWEKLESYSRTLVGEGNELYIVAGGVGTGGTGDNGYAATIDNGRVAVPEKTWKVIIILPIGDNDVSRVTSSTRTIGVIMPNDTAIRPDNWQKYITTVDLVEALTGYDFFSNVDPAIQAQIESRLDAANNTAPTASAQSRTTGEDAATTVTLAGSDPNANNELTYTVVSNPANGTLSGTGANLTYTPNANFFGTDSFTYRASDGTADSSVATVSINVSEVNDAPIVAADSKTTPRDTALTFAATDLTANDNAGAANESGQTLTVTQVVVTAQTRGTVSLSGGQITYTPEPNYTGAAAFDYQVCDNGTTNGAADAKCSISSVNVNIFAPTAASVSVSGRVTNAKGRGVKNVVITMTDANGLTRQTQTSSFGYYRFDDVSAGATVTLTAKAKRFRFYQSTLVRTVNEQIGDADFVFVD